MSFFSNSHLKRVSNTNLVQLAHAGDVALQLLPLLAADDSHFGYWKDLLAIALDIKQLEAWDRRALRESAVFQVIIGHRAFGPSHVCPILAFFNFCYSILFAVLPVPSCLRGWERKLRSDE